MTRGTLARIASYYDELVARHGDSPRSCDFGDPRSQRARFAVLTAVGDLDGSSVLDVGCGLGHLADHLENEYSGVRYVGVDISPGMIEEGKRRRPDLDLRVANVLEEDLGRFDWVISSGIFYLLGDDAEDLMPRLVERLWAHAARGVAWNSLSAWTEDREQGEFYADPLRAVEMMRGFTQRVALRHDYHPRDFTIYAYRA